MKTPLERIRLGALVLTTIVVLSVCGYHLLDLEHDSEWLDDIYFVAITISSVGFTEAPNTSWKFQVFTIGVIVFGMSAAAYTIGGLLQLMTEGEVERAMGVRKMTQNILHLKDHVIICGYGRMGRILAADLLIRKEPFVIIERDPERVRDAQRQGYLTESGDATEEEVLLGAGVERCKVLATGLPADADNVFITLSARNLNEEMLILARGEHPNTSKKLRQAGANRVVMPASIGAQRMAAMITRPSTAEFLELMTDTDTVDVELDEFILKEDNILVGRTVAEVVEGWPHSMLIVAVKLSDGKMIFRPDPEYCLQAADTIILLGQREGIQRFADETLA